jgi:hypothetical protein
MSRTTEQNEADQARQKTSDPVLSMLGIGQPLWSREPGDRFIERLRAEDAVPALSEGALVAPTGDTEESVWHRIQSHQGQEFKTMRGLPFTYTVEGAGIWFFRDGRRINRKLTRTQVDIAVARCPLEKTTEIKDLMDFAYLFALLMDKRIRGQAW